MNAYFALALAFFGAGVAGAKPCMPHRMPLFVSFPQNFRIFANSNTV